MLWLIPTMGHQRISSISIINIISMNISTITIINIIGSISTRRIIRVSTPSPLYILEFHTQPFDHIFFCFPFTFPASFRPLPFGPKLVLQPRSGLFCLGGNNQCGKFWGFRNEQCLDEIRCLQTCSGCHAKICMQNADSHNERVSKCRLIGGSYVIAVPDEFVFSDMFMCYVCSKPDALFNQ